MCDKLKELDKLGRSDLMYSKVRQIIRTGKTGGGASIAIKDRNEVLLTEPEDVKSRWKEYIEELYCASENQSWMN